MYSISNCKTTFKEIIICGNVKNVAKELRIILKLAGNAEPEKTRYIMTIENPNTNFSEPKKSWEEIARESFARKDREEKAS